MKIVGIIAIVLIALYVWVKGKPSITVSYTPAPRGMETALDNKGNKHGYPVGNARDYEKSISRFKNLSKEELHTMIEEDSLNLYEVSNALLILANHHLQKAEVAKGLPLLEVAAYDYHNPLAMVTLARANFQGYQKDPSGTEPVIVRDLEKAFYLVNRAFETAGLLHEKTGQKWALDRSVGGGLGLLDSYQTATVKKEFNAQEHSARISAQVRNDLTDFSTMYKL